MKPMLSPGVAFAATCVDTGTSTVPPGASTARGGTEIVVPLVALCACSVTDQAPAPLPASVSSRSLPRDAAPPVMSRSPSEIDAGSVNTCGLSARATLISPLPSSVTAASFVRSVLPQAGPAVDINADLTCRAHHVGGRWTSSAAAPATCGVAMLLPSNTANGEPG